MRPHLIAAALWLAALPAGAETLTSSTGRLDARLALSDALAAHPRLSGFLRAEALAIRDDYADYAAAEAGAGRWRVVVEDSATFVSPAYASVLRRVEIDTGAARDVFVEPLTWDAGAGDFIRLDAFFDAGEARDEALIAISRHVREAIRTEIWGGAVEGVWGPIVAQATMPDAAVMANFTLTETGGGRAAGLRFHFNPEEVAPGARKVRAVDAPAAVFAEWLNQRGRALFAGVSP